MSFTLDTRLERFKQLKAQFGKISNTDQLTDFIVSRINSNLAKSHSGKGENPHVSFLKFEGQFRKEIANTHCSPIGKPTNWARRDPTLPTSYPGFFGRAWIIYSDRPSGFGSDHTHDTGLNTGTGGYGLYSDQFRRTHADNDAEYAFLNFHSIEVRSKYGLRNMSDSKVQFFPGAVKRLHNAYPLSWDARMYIEDFEDVFGALQTHWTISGDGTGQVSLIYASDTFIKDTHLVKDNFKKIFKESLPSEQNFELDEGVCE